MDIIDKNTTIKEAKYILEAHGCSLAFGWDIVLGSLLEECDYLEIHGFGEKCFFSKMFK